MKTSIGILLIISFFEVRSDNEIQYTPAVERMMQELSECGRRMGPRVMDIKLPYGYAEIPEDNATLSELWGCVWTQLELIDKESKPNKKHIVDYFVDTINFQTGGKVPDRDAIALMVEQCAHFKGNDYGNVAIKIQNCMNSRFIAYSSLVELLTLPR